MRVGLSLEAGVLSLVACRWSDGETPRIVAWSTAPLDAPEDLPGAVQAFVEEHGLRGQPCRCTLSPDDYSLRLIERPTNVPDDELVDATRWLIRDLVEFDVDEAQLAIITVPERSARARPPRMFVVAARPEPIARLVHAIRDAGMELHGIDIVESAMLSLESHLPEVGGGSAVLRTHDKSSVLTLAHEGRLHLARNLSVHDEALEAASVAALDGEASARTEVMQLLDPLILEIQRSLDYYESEYGQNPPTRLTLLPGSVDAAPLIAFLSEALRPLSVERFELDRWLDVEDPPRAGLHSRLTIAAGSALSDGALIGDALLPTGLRVRSESFGLAAVLRIAAAVAVFSCGHFALESDRLASERELLGRLEAERGAVESRIVGSRALRMEGSDGVDPAAEIEALRARRAARLRILRDIGNDGSASASPFSSLLDGLARQDIDEVWLERIELSEGGNTLTLHGRTLRAEDVPRFLRGLGNEPGFADRRFRTLEIERPDDGGPGLAFRLATHESEASSGGSER